MKRASDPCFSSISLARGNVRCLRNVAGVANYVSWFQNQTLFICNTRADAASSKSGGLRAYDASFAFTDYRALFDSATGTVIFLLFAPNAATHCVSFSLRSNSFDPESVQKLDLTHDFLTSSCFLPDQSLLASTVDRAFVVYEYQFAAHDGTLQFQERSRHPLDAVRVTSTECLSLIAYSLVPAPFGCCLLCRGSNDAVGQYLFAYVAAADGLRLLYTQKEDIGRARTFACAVDSEAESVYVMDAGHVYKMEMRAGPNRTPYRFEKVAFVSTESIDSSPAKQLIFVTRSCLAMETRSQIHIIDLLNEKVCLSVSLPASTTGAAADDVSGCIVLDGRLLFNSSQCIFELPVPTVYFEPIAQGAPSQSYFDKWLSLYGHSFQNPSIPYAFAHAPRVVETSARNARDWSDVAHRRLYTPLNFAIYPVLKDAVAKTSIPTSSLLDSRKTGSAKSVKQNGFTDDAATKAAPDVKPIVGSLFAVDDPLSELRSIMHDDPREVDSRYSLDDPIRPWVHPFSKVARSDAAPSVGPKESDHGRMVWTWELLSSLWLRNVPEHLQQTLSPWHSFRTMSRVQLPDLVKDASKLMSYRPHVAQGIESPLCLAMVAIWCGYVPYAKRVLRTYAQRFAAHSAASSIVSVRESPDEPVWSTIWREISNVNSDEIGAADLFALDDEPPLTQDSILDYLGVYLERSKDGTLSSEERETMEGRLEEALLRWKTF